MHINENVIICDLHHVEECKSWKVNTRIIYLYLPCPNENILQQNRQEKLNRFNTVKNHSVIIDKIMKKISLLILTNIK